MITLSIILLFANNVVFNRIKYCDSKWSKDRDRNCEPCPEQAICEKGKVIGCNGILFELRGNKCAYNKDAEIKGVNFVIDIADELSYLNGDNELNLNMRNYITSADFDERFDEYLKNDPNKKAIKKKIYEHFRTGKFGSLGFKKINIVKNGEITENPIFTTLKNYTLKTKTRLFWRKNKPLISSLFGLFLAVFLVCYYIRKRLQKFNSVFKIYGRILEILADQKGDVLPHSKLMDQLVREGLMAKNDFEMVELLGTLRDNKDDVNVTLQDVGGITQTVWYLIE